MRADRRPRWLLTIVPAALFAVPGALLATVVVATIVPGAPAPVLVTTYFDGPRPMVIAHQGGDGVRPSNTLPAFQHAADLGADVLEMDVHQTRDGAFVVMHDTTVDRTTDGSGALQDMTLAEVQALDAAHHWPYRGAHRPYRGQGIHVPTMEEVITRHPGLRFNIEIKPPSAAVGEALCGELTRLGVTRKVLVASFHPVAMNAFRAACPAVPTSAYEREVRWFYLQYQLGLWRIARPSVAALQVPPRAGRFDLTDAGFLAAARSRGLHVDFWTVNDAAEMRALIERGAAGIITDRPDLLLEVLARP